MKVRRGLMLAFLLIVLATQTRAQDLTYKLYLPAVFIPPMDGTMGIWAFADPIEETNNTLNPSGEIAGNFAAVGGGTHTRVTTSQFFGIYSYRLQTAANDEGGTYTLLALANAIHYVTMRVRGTLPAAWDWSLDNIAYTAPVQLIDYDGDWALYGLQFPAAQANGSTLLYVRQNGAGAGDFNVDGINVVASTTWTTHVDGDQEGCEWSGAAHASTSTRSALSRAGGTITDFQDLNFEISGMIGAGMSPITLNVDRFAILPGAELNSVKTQPRNFTLTGVVTGTSRANMQANREALIEAVAPNSVPEQQPIRIRYTGATVVKEIFAYYQAGLEGVISARLDCWELRFALRFLAVDPNFYEVGNSAAVLDTSKAQNMPWFVAKIDGEWTDLGLVHPAGLGTFAFAEDGQYIYVGGNFTNANADANQDYINRYNKDTGVWSSLGAGLNGIVNAIAVGPDGTVYIGGLFTAAGGDAQADFFCTWDGAAFNNLGDPDSGGAAITSVEDIVVAQNGDIYVVGNFTNWDGTGGNYAIYWDLSAGAWTAFPSNPSTIANALALHFNGDIYIGGSFVNWGDANGDRIVRWDGASLFSLNAGIDNGAVLTIGINDTGTVYVGGTFTNFPDAAGDRIIQWNGQVFSSMIEGADNIVYAISVAPDGTVFVAGAFTTIGGLGALGVNVARWNGSSWAQIAISLNTAAPTRAVFTTGQDPVVPSNFDTYLGLGWTANRTAAEVVTVTNGGTEDAFPVIIVSRAGGTTATLASIRNETLGLELLFNYGLLDGESLTITLSPTTKNVVSSMFGQRLDALLPNSDFGPWRLQPGTNEISAFVGVTGVPTITATAEWQDPYWSAD